MEREASPQKASWYAVLTRSRQEKISASMLEYFEVTTFLPLLHQERSWSDRKQRVSLPLFPGYLFVRIVRSGDLQLRVLKVPGVVDFVRDKSGPLPVPEREIENVRAVLTHGADCSPYPFPKPGDRVRVVRGSLAGVEGTLVRNGPKSNLIISVELIQQSVAVSVSQSDLELVSWQAAPEPSLLNEENRSLAG